MKQLEACVSKLCRAACRVVVEVVVAKLDNWRRAISGKADFKPNRKNGFGQSQFVLLDSCDLPKLFKLQLPQQGISRKRMVRAHRLG